MQSRGRVISRFRRRTMQGQQNRGSASTYRDSECWAMFPAWAGFCRRASARHRVGSLKRGDVPRCRTGLITSPPAQHRTAFAPAHSQLLRVRVRTEDARYCKWRAAHAVARQGHVGMHMRPRRDKARGLQYPIADEH
jgi:hypothetical protein